MPMDKTSTPETQMIKTQAPAQPSRPAPRRSTIELLRQLARAYYPSKAPMALVLN